MSASPRRPRNTKLQDRILLFMEQHEVDTVSGLTRKLEGSRPSVSRAINALADGGFVSKNGKGWVLTEDGREEARLIRERRWERPERVDARSVAEAFNVVAESARSLEQISKQARLFNRLLDNTSWVPKEEVPRYRLLRHLMASLNELEETMEPLEELGKLARRVLHGVDTSEDGTNALELDAQDKWLLVEVARGLEGATWALERVSAEMQALASGIDKAKPPDKEANGRPNVSQEADAPHSASEDPLFLICD